MTEKKNSEQKRSGRHGDENLNRRDFFKVGAAAGVGAAGLSAPSDVLAQASTSESIQWNYEADVVVVGAGASGLPCAIRARDAGLDVIVIDQNSDVGGKMLLSGSWVSLGGGDPVQLRDIAGESDKEGFITVPPVHSPDELTDDVDFLFGDVVDWSVLDAGTNAPYRYNDREMHRAWAENCYGTRQFLIDNYVRFSRISGTHLNGGISRARRAVTFLMLGDKTDIKAGTVTQEDAGVPFESSSLFAPSIMSDGSRLVGPGALTNGAALSRCLEFSAREKGVQFMLNRRMTEVIREQPFSGRVLGIKAAYTPRHSPDTGARLESYARNGNIDERAKTIHIRARKGVMVASGGHGNNPEFRSMFYPAMREPAWVSSAWALLGPLGQDASGIIAGMRIGANLAGMQQNLGLSVTYHIPPRLATRDAYTEMYPGHPTFPFRRSTGISLGLSSYEQLIAVNQVGQRFYNELNIAKLVASPVWSGGARRGSPTSSMDHVQGDWRNCDPGWVRQMTDRYAGIDAAIAINEGSEAPDFYCGPLWAIFDQGAIERDGWEIGYPYTADNGYFFTADTIEELADKIYAGHEFQRVPLKHLKATVDTWNAYVDAGSDPDFGRGDDAQMYKIDTPPFYAASMVAVWHDSYGGLRINGKAQVIDMEGNVIPGLYAGGEASGGGNQHGLGRALVQGYMAGGAVIEEQGD